MIEFASEMVATAVEPDGPSATRKALHLFGAGLFGGLVTVFGLAVLAEPLTHSHCHGASVGQREEAADTRRRCMELGITPEELAALDARGS